MTIDLTTVAVVAASIGVAGIAGVAIWLYRNPAGETKREIPALLRQRNARQPEADSNNHSEASK